MYVSALGLLTPSFKYLVGAMKWMKLGLAVIFLFVKSSFYN